MYLRTTNVYLICNFLLIINVQVVQYFRVLVSLQNYYPNERHILFNRLSFILKLIAFRWRSNKCNFEGRFIQSLTVIHSVIRKMNCISTITCYMELMQYFTFNHSMIN